MPDHRFGRNVQCEGSVDTVEHPLIDHVDRPATPFLTRLEHETDAPGEFGPARREDPRRADEHRGVGIMAARMHHVVDLAREVEAGVLGHGQRVHVGAQQDGRPVEAAVEVGHHRGEPVTRSYLETEPVERIQDLGLCPGQIETQLRSAVQRPAQIHQVGQ